MAEMQLVETSLRDGNQSLWAALGIDTASTLSIAPTMDRVGFKAIDLRPLRTWEWPSATRGRIPGSEYV
jgi:pyruvate/oxaloacetate carboxyltransferase